MFLLHESRRSEVLVSDGHHHDRNRSVDEVEDEEVDAINDTTARICTKELVPEEKKSIGLQW